MDDAPQLITPQVINEVEFRQKVRGYDPDEVDDFLERMAIAVAELQDRLRDATERAAEVERRQVGPVPRPAAAVAPRASEPDEIETIRRTLVLAQRTADAAVQEAEQAAAQTVTAAKDEAGRLLDDARARAATIVSEADDAAARRAEDARQGLVAEVEALERTLDDLHGDVEVIERHVEGQRDQLRGSIAVLQQLLDDPSKLSGASTVAPVRGEAGAPSFAVRGPNPDPGGVQDPTSPFAPFPSSASVPTAPPSGNPEGPAASRSPEATPGEGPLARGDGSRDPASGDPASGVPASRPSARAEPHDERSFATLRSEPPSGAAPGTAPETAPEVRTGSPWSHVAADDDDELGLPTGSFRIDDPNATDDAYLDELRKAMIDPESPGRPVGSAPDRPRDDRFARPHDGPLERQPERGDGDAGLFDQDDLDDVSRTRNRFGRRR